MIYVHSILVVINIILVCCCVCSIRAIGENLPHTNKKRLYHSILIAVSSYGGIVSSVLWFCSELCK